MPEHVQQWFETREGVGCNLYFRADLLARIDCDPPLYRFRLRETTYEGRPASCRYRSYATPNGEVSTFRGRKRSIVWYIDHVVEVSSSILGETMRYFSSDLPARVCASHITGHLKNTDCSSEQIHACIAAASAHHRKYAPEYAENLDAVEPKRRRGWFVYVVSAVIAALLLARGSSLDEGTEFLAHIKAAHGFGWMNTTGEGDWEWTIGSIAYRTRYTSFRNGTSLCLNMSVFADFGYTAPWLYHFVRAPKNGTHCFGPRLTEELRSYFKQHPMNEHNFNRAYTHYATFEGILEFTRRAQTHARFYAQGAWVFLVLWVAWTYECRIAPWWEERVKALYGWYTTTAFVGAEAWVRHRWNLSAWIS